MEKAVLGLYLPKYQIQLQVADKAMNQSSVVTEVNIVGFVLISPATLKHKQQKCL